MLKKEYFFQEYRKYFDNKLSKDEVESINLFLDLADENSTMFSKKQWAYIFATVYHETAHTFKPVKEAFWKTEEWRKRNFRYFPYYGRGYVQITWKENYRKFSNIINLDLVDCPEEALEPRCAFYILVYGFKNGVFTGNKITDYINDKICDFKNARKCINSMDKAELIANYALNFEKFLQL